MPTRPQHEHPIRQINHSARHWAANLATTLPFITADTRACPGVGKRCGPVAVDMSMTVHVRRIAPDDGARLRWCLRLAALWEAPGFFWQTVAGVSALPLRPGRLRALRNSAGDAHATFLLETAGDPIGMVEAHQPSLAPEFRELAGMWVAPAVRGTGAAYALLETALNWARTVGAIGVRLWVIPTSTAAVRFYTRHGFEPVGDLQPDTDDPAAKVYIRCCSRWTRRRRPRPHSSPVRGLPGPTSQAD